MNAARNITAPNVMARNVMARNVMAPNVNSGVTLGSVSSVGSAGVTTFFSRYGYVLLAIVILVAVFAMYYQTVGYWFQIGWDKLGFSRSQGEVVKVEIPGGGPSATLTPSGQTAQGGADIGQALSGMAKRLENDVETALGATGTGGKEVFNIHRNIYSYSDAEPLCRAFGAELATYDQVKDAYAAGADWCNYGWVKGQMAVYPTQKSTYEKLQKGPESEQMSCGTPGINGGYFPNADMRFGVNCYGARPAESALDERLQQEERADTTYDRRVNKYKNELDSISVNPWNDKQWSR